MNLKLENIGIVKNADIDIDGLTVIAGENDTGKSTVGKALYFQLRVISDVHKMISGEKELETFPEYRRTTILPKLIFDNQMGAGNIILNLEERKYKYDFGNEKPFSEDFAKIGLDKTMGLPIMIETPLVWNFNKFFNQMSIIESQMGMYGDELSIDYPFFLKELHFRLSIKSKSESYHIENDISSIINGDFKKDDLGNFFFVKKDKRIELLNTATGIKYFGIFQVLSQNNYLNENTILILDEPEVHLHPKWQLKMAELIVELVKNGVKILVNSHSPYMIEALQRYSQIAQLEDKTNFYLAQDGVIDKIENSNSRTLSEIFEKLSEPYDVFEKMESDRF